MSHNYLNNTGVNKLLSIAKAYTDNKVAELVDSAPSTLDTLQELSKALGDDPNFATTITNLIADKQPKDADLTAIAGLTGTSGLLKKTAANTWALDTNTYATQSWVTGKGYLTGITKAQVTTALGYTPPTTDTNTWRPVVNNLTSTATDSSLSAAQGKVLNDKFASYLTTSAASSTYLPKAGGSMNRDATIKLNTYGTRFLTISGNNISADMSNETGGWAGAFASVKAPGGTTTTMLGWYGTASGLTHIYMGGAYNAPYMKMTAAGDFTFNKSVTATAGITASDIGVSDFLSVGNGDQFYADSEKVNIGHDTPFQVNKIKAPTSSGGSTYGLGTNGQVLKTNGTNVYWANDNNTTYTFSNKNATLAWGTTSTIATVGGTDIKVTMPANPDTNTTYTDATTSKSGLMSSTDKTRVDSMWNVWSADGTSNTLVNKVQEVLTVFNNFPEGDNLVTLLAGKLDKTGGTLTGDLSLGQNKIQALNGQITGLVTSDITLDDDGYITFNKDSENSYEIHFPYKDGTVALTSDLSNYLPKTTYEYNKEIAFGSTGKLYIGAFPMYDSNITVEISATTSTTYNATLVIATQNINTTGGGSLTATVYGDATNTIAPNIYIGYASGSNQIHVYFSPQSWSKNLIHIQAVALAGTPSNVCTSVDSIPSTANRQPTNALTANFQAKGNYLTGITKSMVTTALGYTPPTTDTQNTVGAKNKASTTLYLVGVSGGASNTPKESNINTNCYIGSDNCLYSNGSKVLTSHQSLSGYATQTWVEGKGYITKTTADGAYQAKGTYITPTTGSEYYSKYIQTRLQNKTSWYGAQYPIYAWWETGSICKWVVDNYETKVDRAVKDANGNTITSYYQPKLTSGTNIKTINGTSLLGSGDITISGGDYLPLTGGTLTGSITFSHTNGLHGGMGSIGFNDEGGPTIIGPYRSIAVGTNSLDGDYNYYTFPDKEGTIALLSDLTGGSSSGILTVDNTVEAIEAAGGLEFLLESYNFVQFVIEHDGGLPMLVSDFVRTAGDIRLTAHEINTVYNGNSVDAFYDIFHICYIDPTVSDVAYIELSYNYKDNHFEGSNYDESLFENTAGYPFTASITQLRFSV